MTGADSLDRGEHDIRTDIAGTKIGTGDAHGADMTLGRSARVEFVHNRQHLRRYEQSGREQNEPAAFEATSRDAAHGAYRYGWIGQCSGGRQRFA